MRQSPKKILLWLLCFLAVLATGIQLASFLYTQQAKSKGLEVLKGVSSKINTTSFAPLFTASARLARHELIVSTIQGNQPADNREVVSLLITTRYLLESSLVYLLDNKGNTVACTPYGNKQKTLTGINYAFRPYFIKPMTTGQPFSYIALGVTTGKPGIYHATPVINHGDVIGVLVVKISLNTINQVLRNCPFPIAMLNEDGIIIAANNDDWLYRAGFPVNEQTRQKIVASRQFADKQLQPLAVDLSKKEAIINQQKYLRFTRPIGFNNWNIVFLYLPGTGPVLFFLKYISLVVFGAVLVFFGCFLVVSRRKTLRELQRSETQYKSIITHMPVAFFRIDLSKKITLASPAILKLYGGDNLAEIVGKPIHDLLVVQADRKNFLDQIDESGDIHDYECLFKRKDGSALEILVNASYYFNLEGRKEGIEGTFYDISERKKLENKLHLLGEAIEVSANAIAITDLEGKISWVNRAFTQLTGYEANEVIGANPNVLNSGIHNDDFFKQMWETILQGKVWHGELQNKRKDGTIYYEEMTITPIHDQAGGIGNFIAVKSDITVRKESEKERECYLQNERILTDVAKSLLGGEINKQSFLGVLEKIRVSINASRAVIFEFIDEPAHGKCMNLLYGAYTSTDSHENFMEHFSYYQYRQNSSWYQRMEAGKTFVSMSSHENGESPIFSKSLLTAPFFEGDTLAGFWTIDDMVTERKWSSSEISFVTTIAEILGSYFGNLATTKKLAHEREKSDAANKAKSSFLANMSHEIRTPMNAIIGMTHLTLETELTDKQQTYISSVQEAAQNLLIIINEILDFSKIEEGKMQLESRPFSLHEIIASTIRLITQKAKDKGIEIETDLHCPPFELIGDSHKLGQILLNLCDNAVKYTEMGRVLLKVSWQQRKNKCLVSFAVEDTGIGIEDKSQDILFQSFTQADASITRKHGGTGLGLAISSKLVDLMGGELALESRLGHGSTFSFAVHFKVGNTLNELDLLPQEAPHYLDSPEGIPAELVVLLVEDNEFNRMLAIELLKKQGAKITVAVNGQEAIDKIKAETFDLVLMDIQMPVLDGLAATRKIRALEGSYFKNVPIIAMTANAISGDREKCLNAGMTGYLTKPFEPTSFYAEISKYRKKQDDLPLKNHPAPVNAPPPVVLDTVAGLQRLMGNKKMQLQVLANFNKEFMNCIPEMKDAWQQGNHDVLLRLVHTLKGAAGTVGGSIVQNTAIHFEQLLKEDPKPFDFQKEIKILEQHLSTLFGAIKDVLGVDSPEIEESALPQNNLQGLHALLSEFSSIIGQAKIAYSKELTTRLAEYSWPSTTSSAVERLKKALSEYNFKMAKSILDALCEEIAEKTD